MYYPPPLPSHEITAALLDVKLTNELRNVRVELALKRVAVMNEPPSMKEWANAVNEFAELRGECLNVLGEGWEVEAEGVEVLVGRGDKARDLLVKHNMR